MDKIARIRQEIERRKKENMYDELPMTIGRYYEDRDLLSFLDTLPEEPDSLEEAAGLYLDNHKPLTRYNWGDLMDAFKAGAEWQKTQMMKETVEADVNTYELTPGGFAYVEFVVDMPAARFKFGDKVKIIVLKP